MLGFSLAGTLFKIFLNNLVVSDSATATCGSFSTACTVVPDIEIAPAIETPKTFLENACAVLHARLLRIDRENHALGC